LNTLRMLSILLVRAANGISSTYILTKNDKINLSLFSALIFKSCMTISAIMRDKKDSLSLSLSLSLHISVSNLLVDRIVKCKKCWWLKQIRQHLDRVHFAVNSRAFIDIIPSFPDTVAIFRIQWLYSGVHSGVDTTNEINLYEWWFWYLKEIYKEIIVNNIVNNIVVG